MYEQSSLTGFITNLIVFRNLMIKTLIGVLEVELTKLLLDVW